MGSPLHRRFSAAGPGRCYLQRPGARGRDRAAASVCGRRTDANQVVGAALTALTLSATPALAETSVLTGSDGDKTRSVEVEMTLGTPNLYFSGGTLHGDEGILLQPGAAVDVTVSEEAELHVFAGLWASVHQQAAAARAPSMLHEADFFAGVEVGLGGGVAMATKYAAVTSPSGAFETRHELAMAFEFDDSALWSAMGAGAFQGFHPASALVLDLEATNLRDGAGIGSEIGLSPTFGIVAEGDLTVTLAIPVGVSFVAHGDPGATLAFPAYESFHAGGKLELGLGFVPAPAGEWTASASAAALALSDEAASANGDRTVVFIGSVELAATF